MEHFLCKEKKVLNLSNELYCVASTWCQFHQRSTRSFYTRRSQKRKISVKLSVSFYAFDIHARKSCSENEIDTWPGVNFINILRAAFELEDPQSAKKTNNLTIFLRFWDLRK